MDFLESAYQRLNTLQERHSALLLELQTQPLGMTLVAAMGHPVVLKVDDSIAEEREIIHLIHAEKASLQAEKASLQAIKASNARIEKLKLEELKVARARIDDSASQPAREHPSEDEDEEEEEVMLLERKAKPASRFTASNCCIPAVGYNSMMRERFMEPISVTLRADHMPSDIQIKQAKRALETARIAQIHPAKIHETQGVKGGLRRFEFTVDEIMGSAIADYLSPLKSRALIHFDRQGKTLENLNAKIGPASEASHANLFVYSTIPAIDAADGEPELVGTGVWEWKDTAHSSQEAVGQAYSEASNLVLSQYEYGVPSEQCMVGVFVSNGRLCQFAYVTLLQPTCPVLHMISDVLDLYDDLALMEAARHLHNLREFFIEQDNLLQRLALAPKNDRDSQRRRLSQAGMAISLVRYHMKPFKKILKRLNSYSASIMKQYRIYSCLHQNQYLDAVLPLAILSAELTEDCYHRNDHLVSPKLDREFKMGFPLDPDDMKLYLETIKASMKKLHRLCRVVHMDAYPTNILWHKRIMDNGDSDIEIKIVDWDAASFMDEPIDPGIAEAIRKNDELAPYYWSDTPAEDKPDPRHDAWFVFIASLMTTADREFLGNGSNDIEQMLLNYQRLVDGLHLQFNPLVTAFELWFEEQQWNTE